MIKIEKNINQSMSEQCYATVKLDWIRQNADIHRGYYDAGRVYPPSGLEFPYVVLHNNKSGRTICIPVRELSPEERSIRRLRRKLAIYIRGGAEDRLFKSFWTFTFKNKSDFVGNGQPIRKTFNKIQTYRRNKGLPKISYCWKYEEGEKRKRPHFHALVNGYVPRKYVEKVWGYGFVHMKGITNSRMAMTYVGKYFSKDQMSCEYWKYGKRFSSTRDIPKAPKSDWMRIGWSKEPLDLTQDFWKRGPMGNYI